MDRGRSELTTTYGAVTSVVRSSAGTAAGDVSGASSGADLNAGGAGPVTSSSTASMDRSCCSDYPLFYSVDGTSPRSVTYTFTAAVTVVM